MQPGAELGLHEPTKLLDPVRNERRQDDHLKGWVNATGEVIIEDMTGMTVVSDDRVTPDSSIALQPTDAEGQAMINKVFVQTLRPGWAGKLLGTTVGDFILEHPLFARDYTFRYLILG